MNCSRRRRGVVSQNHWLVETEFRSRRGREANERVTVGRLMMMRGVQSVGAFWGKAGGWRQAGCAMMMDVIYRLDHPSPPRSTSAAREYLRSQSQSSLVSPPVWLQSVPSAVHALCLLLCGCLAGLPVHTYCTCELFRRHSPGPAKTGLFSI